MSTCSSTPKYGMAADMAGRIGQKTVEFCRIRGIGVMCIQTGILQASF